MAINKIWLSHQWINVKYRVRRLAGKTLSRVFAFLMITLAFATFITMLAIWIISSGKIKDEFGIDISFLQATWRIIKTATLSLYGEQIADLDRKIVSEYANAYVFGISWLAVVASSLYVFQEKQNLKRAQPYFERKFKSTNADVNKYASAIMWEYYNDSAKVLIVSGDYDWLFSHDGIKIANHLVTLIERKNVKLLSHKKVYDVLSQWQKHEISKRYKVIFEAMMFQCPVQIKASLLTSSNGDASFIFLSKDSEDRSKKAFSDIKSYTIYDYHSGGSAKTLIPMIRDLTLFAEQTTSEITSYKDDKEHALKHPWWAT